MRHGDNFGDTWPKDDPLAGRNGTDPYLSNVNAPMGAWLILNRAFCSCDARCTCDEEDPERAD